MPENLLAKGITSIVVLAIAIGLFLFWINMIIDCARRNFRKTADKVLWFIALILFLVVGAFIYWLLVYRKS